VSEVGPFANPQRRGFSYRALGHPVLRRLKEATMPKEWSEKRERQYEHIKEGYEDEGVSTKEAKRRAAATVNESRRKSGETKKKRS
jgi:hypothetical protein